MEYSQNVLETLEKANDNLKNYLLSEGAQILSYIEDTYELDNFITYYNSRLVVDKFEETDAGMYTIYTEWRTSRKGFEEALNYTDIKTARQDLFFMSMDFVEAEMDGRLLTFAELQKLLGDDVSWRINDNFKQCRFRVCNSSILNNDTFTYRLFQVINSDMILGTGFLLAIKQVFNSRIRVIDTWGLPSGTLRELIKVYDTDLNKKVSTGYYGLLD